MKSSVNLKRWPFLLVILFVGLGLLSNVLPVLMALSSEHDVSFHQQKGRAYLVLGHSQVHHHHGHHHAQPHAHHKHTTSFASVFDNHQTPHSDHVIEVSSFQGNVLPTSSVLNNDNSLLDFHIIDTPVQVILNQLLENSTIYLFEHPPPWFNWALAHLKTIQLLI